MKSRLTALYRVIAGNLWQHSLQRRIITLYGGLFLFVLILLLIFVGEIIYTGQIEQSEHELEIAAFLIANALEEPLSHYGVEPKEIELEDDDNGEEENEYQIVLSGTENNITSSHLQELTSEYALGIEARVTILNANGKAVADSTIRVQDIANQTDKIEVQAALNGSEQHDIRLHEEDGKRYLFAAAPIQQGEFILGVVQLSVPMTQVIQPILILFMWVAFAGIIALFVLIGVGYRLGKNLVYPLKMLDTTAKSISAGNLEMVAPVLTNDEVGTLAESFNNMVDRLRQLIEQQRLFIANASHELRTPLTNIKLRSEALTEMSLAEWEVAQRFIREIDSEADRLGRLSTRLLDLSRLEQAVLTKAQQSTAVVPILESVTASMMMQANLKNLSLRCQFPPNLPAILVSPEDLELICLNLIENAVKYTPAGGEISVTARSTDTHCQMVVTDSGIGISTKDLPFIFDKFYRADKARSRQNLHGFSGSGSGLGLAIVKQLVGKNNGEIWVESKENAGTSFFLVFPIKIA